MSTNYGQAWDPTVVDKGRDLLSGTYTPKWNNKRNFLQMVVRLKKGHADVGTALGGTLSAPTGGASGMGFHAEWNATDGVYDASLSNTTTSADKGGVIWGVTCKGENGVPIDQIEAEDLFTLITSAEIIEYGTAKAGSVAGDGVRLTANNAIISTGNTLQVMNAFFATGRTGTLNSDGSVNLRLRDSFLSA